jgi:hypothetical protein
MFDISYGVQIHMTRSLETTFRQKNNTRLKKSRNTKLRNGCMEDQEGIENA